MLRAVLAPSFRASIPLICAEWVFCPRTENCASPHHYRSFLCKQKRHKISLRIVTAFLLLSQARR